MTPKKAWISWLFLFLSLIAADPCLAMNSSFPVFDDLAFFLIDLLDGPISNFVCYGSALYGLVQSVAKQSLFPIFVGAAALLPVSPIVLKIHPFSFLVG